MICANKENLLKIEGSSLHETSKVSLVFVYGDPNSDTQIYYKFYEKYNPTAHMRTNYVSGEVEICNLYCFDTVEDVLAQVYYITGDKLTCQL